jgi:hypothetical protein
MYQKQTYEQRKPEERKGVNRPETVFQMEGADVAVWKNTRRKENNEIEVFYKVTLNGTYLDKEEKRRFTKGILVDDIPAAIEGLQQVYERYHEISDNIEQREKPESKESLEGLEAKV